MGDGGGEHAVTVYSGATSTGYLLFADGASSSDRYAGQVRYNHSTNAMEFAVNNSSTAKLTINSSGNATFSGTSSALTVIARDNLFVGAGQLYIGAENSATDNTFRQVVNTSAGSFTLQKRISGTFTDILSFNNANNATFAGDITLGANHIGRDEDNYIGFETDNLIKLRVAGATQLKISDGVFTAQTDSDVDLGSSGTRFKELWVDSINGGSVVPGSYLPLAGNTTATAMTGDIFLANQQQVRFLTSANAIGLRMQSSGTNSFIDNEVGDMYIRQEADNKDMIFQADDGFGSNATYFKLDGSLVNGTTTLGAVNFPDKSKLFFGSDSDLRIYHDGSDSYIQDSGTGQLYIAAENFRVKSDDLSKAMISANVDGAVSLYYANALKLATTSSGVAVTGAATATTATTSTDNNATLTTKGYVDGLVTGVPVYKGTWDARNVAEGGATDGGNPDLRLNANKVLGNYYIVSTAGSATPNGSGTGPNSWNVGDWCIFSDVTPGTGTDLWQKIDNTSVISGAGTGQSVTKWDGTSGATSETLTDGPITFSSNDSTFAGDLYIPNKIIHVGDDDTWMQFETNVISLRTGGADRLTLTNSLATISEPLLIDGVLNYTGLEVKGTGASRPSVNLSNATTGILGQVYATESSALVFATTTSGTTALTLDSSQNATFAGKIIAGQGVQFTGGTIAAATTVLHTNNVVYARGGSGGMFLQNSDGSDGMFIANDHVRIETGSSERMRIIANGNVGIGTTSPRGKLQINGNSNSWNEAPSVRLWDTTNSKGWLVGNVNNYTAGDFYIRTFASVNADPTSAAQEFTIKHATGNVGIGTTLPDRKLHVNSGSDNANTIFESTDTAVTIRLKDSTGSAEIESRNDFRFSNNAGVDQRMVISSAGAIKFNNYNSTNNTGTPTYLLGTDASGNVVKTNSAPSPITSQAASLYDLIPNGAFTTTYAFTSTAGTYAKVMQGDDVITANGTYTVQMFVNDHAVGGTQYSETYSGIMSWGSSTNTNDTGGGSISEIVLHRSGHAANQGMTYLRTRETTSSEGNELRLEIMCNRTYTGASNVVFKFVRLI